MRDFYAVESSVAVEREIINVESIQYDRSAGEIAETKLPGFLLRQPDVICFSEPLYPVGICVPVWARWNPLGYS